MKTRAALRELLKRGYQVIKIREKTGLASKGQGPAKSFIAEMRDGTFFEIGIYWRVKQLKGKVTLPPRWKKRK